MLESRATRDYRPRHSFRRGISLVEMVVAIGMLAVFIMLIGNLFSQSLRTTATTLNEYYANSIADNLWEHVRAIDYESLRSLGFGSNTVLVNGDNASPMGPAVRENPVLLELRTLSYSEIAKNSKFRGTVTLRVDDGPYIDTSLVTIVITWSDSQFSSPRTVLRSGLINKVGSRYWG